MPQNAALARKWIKFNDDGTRGDTRIESANIEVIPPMSITEVVDGDEIMQTIPAHYVDDAEQGAVYVPEQTVGTGTFEKVTKVVGQTPEQYASKINADGTFEPFDLTGYIEVTHEEYLLYSGNSSDGKEYVRNMETGEPMEKPPYVPTAEEKLAMLDAEYQQKFDEINDAIIIAVTEGDTDLQQELVAEKSALKEEYTAKRGEL